LTPYLVKQIVLDNRETIKSGLEKPANRLVVITFASTASLLRKIQGNQSDRPIAIEFLTIEDGRKMNTQSQVLKNCNPDSEFCVIIATWLPVSSLGLGPDQILTHTTTGFKLDII
jgi:hypothetical protein